MSAKSTLSEELVHQFHPTRNAPVLALEVAKYSHAKIWWVCPVEEDHIWEATPASRSKGSGCLYCTGQKVLPGYNDLASHYPEIASEWHRSLNGDLKATEVTKTSGKKVWWLCSCGNAYQSRVSHRTGRGHSCPKCSAKHVGRMNQKTTNTDNAAVLFPHLLLEWDKSKNSTVTLSDYKPGSDYRAWWLCGKGHSWQAIIGSRVKGYGCPLCGHQKASISRSIPKPGKSIADVNPELVSQWNFTLNDKTPDQVSSGSEYKAWWLCDKGHSWAASVYTRVKQKTNCPTCWQKTYISRFETDVAETLIGQGYSVQRNLRKLLGNRQEIDVYLPELRIGIECNGVYYHSDRWKPSDYHYTKYQNAQKAKLRLIQIWEDDWRDDKETTLETVLKQIAIFSSVSGIIHCGDGVRRIASFVSTKLSC